MIRLAVSGNEARWRDIALRLRGATIVSCGDFSQEHAPHTDCDAVLFVESGRIETELIERCLSARKHVLLVATSWLSSEVLETLSVVARRTGAQLAVVNPDRFLPSRQLIRQQLNSGKLGEPGLVRMHRWEPGTAENAESLPELPPPLIRDLDLAVSLMRESPNSVYAVNSTPNDRDNSSGRCMLIHLGFSGGGMALIDYADRLPPGDDYVSLSVIGSLGAAYADDHQNMQLVYRGGHPQSVRVDERDQQLVPLVQDFVDGLRANRDSSESVTEWLRVLAVAESVRRSLVARQAFELEL